MHGHMTVKYSNYINYKSFANIKGTIYRNSLPRGTQVEKGLEPLL
jgi:hypothetical protein